MIPSMATGMAVGAFFAASLSAAHVRLAVGLIAALFVLRHWLGTLFERVTIPPSTLTGVAFGAIGGSRPCWPMPAVRHGKCISFLSNSTSSPMSAR